MPRGGNTTADEAAIRAATAARLAAAITALGHATADLARGAFGSRADFLDAEREVAFWTRVDDAANISGVFDDVPDDVRGIAAGRQIDPPGGP